MRGEVTKKLICDCPFCEAEHEVSVIQYNTCGLVKDTEVHYMKTAYYCEQEREEFAPAAVMYQNLYEAREAYRKENALLQVEEIKAMTGLVYQHKPFGVLPLAHNDLIRLPGLRVTEEEHDDYVAYRIESGLESVKGQFTEEELAVMDAVIDKFSRFSTKEIVAYMHDENAYKMTKDNELISFTCDTFIHNW